MKVINRRLVLLMIPFMAGFMLFYFIPLLASIRYSFIKSMFDNSFVQFDNYVDTLNNRYFRLSIGNTFTMIITGVPLLLICGLCMALLIRYIHNQNPALCAALILPMLLPSSAVSGVFSKMPFEDPRIVLIAIYIWKNAGFITLVFLAAFSMIPASIYEAAALDGAGRIRRFFVITLPLISGAILFSTILATAYNLRLFREAYLIFGAYPDNRVYLTQHYMNNHFYKLNYQRLTTASALFSVVLFSSVWAGVRLAGRFSGERDLQ